jgi:hypothetical protein
VEDVEELRPREGPEKHVVTREKPVKNQERQEKVRKHQKEKPEQESKLIYNFMKFIY